MATRRSLSRSELEPHAVRFFDKVKQLEPIEACWLWRSGSRQSTPSFQLLPGENVKISRFAWAFARGTIGDDEIVEMQCGDRRCVRIDHMRLLPGWQITRRAVGSQTKSTAVRDVSRFTGRVFKHPNGCWYWRGSTSGDYGVFWIGGAVIFAHRASWFLFRGADPGGAVVRHRCDNSICVNPDHLELGTPADNANDAVARGRIAHGRDIGTAVLTDAEVAFIRSRCPLGVNGALSYFAAQYGVAIQTIRSIVIGTTWRHVLPQPGIIPMTQQEVRGLTKRARGSNNPNAKLSEAQAHEVLRLHFEEGVSVAEIVHRCGVKRWNAYAIIDGKAWAHLPRPASAKKSDDVA